MGVISNLSFGIANWKIDREFRKAEMQNYMHDSDDYEIQYWDNRKEDKPVLLILHGLGAMAKYQWFEQLEVLSNYRIIIPNLLHFGKSKPKSKKYAVEDQIDMIQFLVGELKLSSYSLMGASYGGLISGEIANRFPDQVERLVLVDAAIKFVYDSDNKRVCDEFGVASVRELFAPSTPAALRKLIVATVGKYGLKPPTFTLKGFHDALYAYNLDDKRKVVMTMVAAREKYEKHEYNFEMPVHLIWGECDRLIPADRGKLFHEHIGNGATLDIIKKGGHMPNMNRTRAFNKLLRQYLKD
ncbi:MAG: pimeloyl-ACP methyl ester carboxylesterase [Crocinitomicaceae bacterium]|jgi:pimeloyl-ACP methyl ester carboxylesterase